MLLHRITSTFGRRDRVCDELGEFNKLRLWRFLFGFGVAKFIFRRRIAFLFRVAEAYVIGGAILSSFSTLGFGAMFGGCTGGDGGNGIVITLGSDARSSFAGLLSPGKDIGGIISSGSSYSPSRASSKVDLKISAITLRAATLLPERG